MMMFKALEKLEEAMQSDGYPLQAVELEIQSLLEEEFDPNETGGDFDIKYEVYLFLFQHILKSIKIFFDLVGCTLPLGLPNFRPRHK